MLVIKRKYISKITFYSSWYLVLVLEYVCNLIDFSINIQLLRINELIWIVKFTT